MEENLTHLDKEKNQLCAFHMCINEMSQEVLEALSDVESNAWSHHVSNESKVILSTQNE